jgi:GntR family transcriptional regulator
MFRKLNPTSGIPIYKQLKDQIRHLIEIGALKQGDQLPSLRTLSEMLVINPNTVVRVYRELELEGVIEVSHGLGAFIATTNEKKAKTQRVKDAQEEIRHMIETFKKKGLTIDEIRRLMEAAFMQLEVH